MASRGKMHFDAHEWLWLANELCIRFFSFYSVNPVHWRMEPNLFAQNDQQFEMFLARQRVSNSRLSETHK
jgi:hypothetical protein